MARGQGGRERILDAALQLFSERGPASVSMRDIAGAAGVSPALVVHHFGSKAGLKDAVDSRVAEFFARLRDELLAEVPRAVAAPAGVDGVVAQLLRLLPPDSPLPGYVRHMMLGGDEAGKRIYAAWMDIARGLMASLIEDGVARPTNDLDARVAIMVSINAALFVFHEQIAHAAGFDPTTPEGLDRWARTLFGIYTQGVFLPPATG